MSAPRRRRRLGFWFALGFSLWAVEAAASPQASPPCASAVLTLAEAAELLRIDGDELKRLAERARVPARRVGQSWRFSCAALMAWLNGESTLTPQGLSAVAGAGTDGQATAIGEAPKTRAAEDVFLRGRRVLLGRGEVVADVGQFFSRSDNLRLAAVDDRLALATVQQETLTTLLVGRVGVFNETEIFASTAFFAQDAQVFFGNASLASNRRKDFGGVSVGVRRTLLQESAGRPDIIGTFDVQIPTGDTSYAVGAGMTFVKSVDPVVLFATANYNRGFSRNLSNQTRLRSGNRLELSAGYGWALNDTLAVSTAVSTLFTGTTTIDNAIFRQADVFSLRLALTSWLAKGLYIEPSVSFGLNGPRDTFALGVTMPYSF